MRARSPSQIQSARYLHEILFSLYTSFVIANLVLWNDRQTFTSWLFKIDRSIRIGLQMRLTDVATTDFVFPILSLALAICVWGLLRLSSNTRITESLLRTGSGIAALGALPALFLFGYPLWWRYDWTIWHLAQITVLGLTVFVALRYASNDLPFPVWIGGLIFTLHWALWLGPVRIYLVYPFVFEWATVVMWIAALSSSVAWVFYLRQLRRNGISRSHAIEAPG